MFVRVCALRRALCLVLGMLAGAALAQQSPATANALPPSVTRALAAAQVPTSAVAMMVMPLPAAGDAAAPAPLLAWRAEEPMNPASVMKLVTTYAGLDALGPAYFWRTRIEASGRIEDGTLHGNLLVRGSGDPKLVIERLTDLIAAIQEKGVRSITGDILLDHSIFDLPEHDAAAFDRDPLRAYNVGPDGLLMNFTTLVLSFEPDGNGGVRVGSEPPLAGVYVPATVPAGKGACGDWATRLGASFADGAQEVRFAGRYPTSCGARTLTLAYADQGNFAPRMFEGVWRASGAQLGGRARWLQPYELLPPPTPLVTGYSLPLREIIADINKFSNNVMAQQLFLTLSAQDGKKGSFTASRQWIAGWWQQRFGAQVAAPQIDNGAGLSRTARVSAASLAALLTHAAGSAHAQDFEQSLSIAGVDGTAKRMGKRSPGSVALGRVTMKTGTLRDVAAVAGYAYGMSGRKYAVIGLVNHPNAGASRPALDRLLEWAVMDGQ